MRTERLGRIHFTGAIETWQRADGSWNWVLIDRPTVHEPGEVVWDSTPYASARAAIYGFDLWHQRCLREAGL